MASKLSSQENNHQNQKDPSKMTKATKRQPMQYVAYDAGAGEYFEFPTFEDAQHYLLYDCCGTSSECGYHPDFMNGHSYVAKITHRSDYKVTERREDYMCLVEPDQFAHCSDCAREILECSGGEEWPYGSEFDVNGEGFMQPVDPPEPVEALTKKVQELEQVIVGKDQMIDSLISLGKERHVTIQELGKRIEELEQHQAVVRQVHDLGAVQSAIQLLSSLANYGITNPELSGALQEARQTEADLLRGLTGKEAG